ncbi:hypothetical protein HYFRA_00004364 [Hymenoscyphus fraxineus]|uniref:Uncharacterized protein n=1 Tax=Hymenoscyphus fraxineus TaxID=746836 RepID=A0A9N9PNI6_9HELO|nr:hypothetical protein HYFRA_00004364 [Hymenoscyphus fraxineus]
MTEINSAPEFESIATLKAVKAGHVNDVDIAARVLANNLNGLDKTAISAAVIYNLRSDLNLAGQ